MSTTCAMSNPRTITYQCTVVNEHTKKINEQKTCKGGEDDKIAVNYSAICNKEEPSSKSEVSNLYAAIDQSAGKNKTLTKWQYSTTPPSASRKNLMIKKNYRMFQTCMFQLIKVRKNFQRIRHSFMPLLIIRKKIQIHFCISL